MLRIQVGWIIQPDAKSLTSSKNVALAAALIAVGALTRILLANVIIFTPQPFYGWLIPIGLAETLTFVSGFTLGPVTGFVTGASIIVISDMATLPGAWTPFIASIIGIIGITAGILRKVVKQPTFLMMTLFSIPLTLMSETLQNVSIALLFSTPVIPTILFGMPTMVVALANNLILFPTVGLRVIKMILTSSTKGSNNLTIEDGAGGEVFARNVP
jgi:hypothetical protein